MLWSQVHPEITTLAGFALPTADFLTLSGPSTWKLNVGLLLGNTPGDTATLGLNIAGRPYGQMDMVIKPNPIDSIRMVVQTPVLYVDSRTISVGYQVMDAYGSTQVDVEAPRGALSVLQMIVEATNHTEHVFACIAPDPVSGIGSCVGELPRILFSVSGDMSFPIHLLKNAAQPGPMVRSDMGLITLKQWIGDTRPDSAGMLYSLPVSPAVAQQQIVVPLVANTDGAQLYKWLATVQYRGDAVAFESAITGHGFRTTVVEVLPDTAGGLKELQISSFASGLAADATGADVLLTNLQFTVLTPLEPAADVTYLNAVHVKVVSMISSTLSYMVLDVPASMIDPTGINVRSPVGGRLTVTPVDIVGIFAYTTKNAIVNTARLDGKPIYSAIGVEGVYNHPAVTHPNAHITADSDCSVGAVDVSALRVHDTQSFIPTYADANCIVEVNQYHDVASTDIPVNVNYLTTSHDPANPVSLSTTVSMTVWSPILINVRVRDHELQSIR